MIEEQQKAQLGKFLTVSAFLILNIVVYFALDALSESDFNQEIFFYLMCIPPLINCGVLLLRVGDFFHWSGLMRERKARFDAEDLRELKMLKRRHRAHKKRDVKFAKQNDEIKTDNQRADNDTTPNAQQEPSSKAAEIEIDENPADQNNVESSKDVENKEKTNNKDGKTKKDKKNKSNKSSRMKVPATSIANRFRVTPKISPKKKEVATKEKSHRMEHISKPKKQIVCILPIYKEDVDDLLRTILSLEENVRNDPYIKLSIVMIIDGKDDEMQQKAISFLRLHFRLNRIDTLDKEGVDVHRRKDHKVRCACGRGYSTIDTFLLVKHKNGGKYDSQKLFFNFIHSETYYRAFRRAKGLLMVDSDTLIAPTAVSLLYDELIGSPPHLGGVCGEVVEESGRRFLSNWFQGLLNAQYAEFKVSHWMAKRLESLFGVVTCLPGCFCMFRMSAINDPRVGPLFVEQNPQSLFKRLMVQLGEDRYLTLLLHHAGYTCKMAHKAVAYTRLVPNLERFLVVRKRWTNSTLANNLALAFSFKAWLPANHLNSSDLAHVHVETLNHSKERQKAKEQLTIKDTVLDDSPAAAESQDVTVDTSSNNNNNNGEQVTQPKPASTHSNPKSRNNANDETDKSEGLSGALAVSKKKDRKKNKNKKKTKEQKKKDKEKEKRRKRQQKKLNRYTKPDRWTRFVDWCSYAFRYPLKWPMLFVILVQTAVFFVTPAVFFKIMAGLANSLNFSTVQMPGEVIIVIIIIWALLNVILTMTVNAATNPRAVAIYRTLTIVNCFLTGLSLIGLPLLLINDGLGSRHQILLLIASILWIFATLFFLIIHFEFRSLLYIPFLLVLTPLYTIIVAMYSIFHLDDFTWGRESLGSGKEIDLNMTLPSVKDRGLIAASLIMANTRVVAARVSQNKFRDYMPPAVLNYVRNRWNMVDELDSQEEVRIEVDGGGQNNAGNNNGGDEVVQTEEITVDTSGTGSRAVSPRGERIVNGEEKEMSVKEQDWFKFLVEQNKYNSVEIEFFGEEPKVKEGLKTVLDMNKRKKYESYIKRVLREQEDGLSNKRLYGIVMINEEHTDAVYTVVRSLVPSSLKDWDAPRGEWYMADQYSADVFPPEALEKIQPPYLLCFEKPPKK